jgi:ABC-type oligopeptide transport system substrate-binding subunit
MARRFPGLLHRIAAAAALLFTAACSEPANDPGATAATVYRHAMDGAPRSLDPAQASSVYAKMLVVNLYDTLYRYKYLARPYELTPNLADGMPQVSTDGLIYTIRIKPGARFMDDEAFPGGAGRAVTAEDFVYSLKRHFDPATRSRGAWLWQDRIVGMEQWKTDGADYDAPVSGLRAIDERTIQIQLITPFPQLTHTLAQGFAAVVPREAVEHYGAGFAINPVGSGPYRLDGFDSSGATLLRNDSFRHEPFSLEAEGADPAAAGTGSFEHLEGRAPPFIDRIEVQFIAEDAARWNTLIAGEADFIKVPVSQFDSVLASRAPPRLNADMAARFDLAANLESGFVHTDFNMDDPAIGYHPDPDQDARNRGLRCAIVKAFDWERRNDVFYYGIGACFPASSHRSPPSSIRPRTVPGQNATWTARGACFASPAGTRKTCRRWNTVFRPASRSGRCSSSFEASWPTSATRRKKSAP